MEHVKYPRTLHLPFSPGKSRDDLVMPTDEGFVGFEVVVTEKMDGENTTIYRDGWHARSINNLAAGGRHWSRTKMSALWSAVQFNIPEDMRICGESLYGKHSIEYTDLLDFFLVFSIWQGDTCLSWDDTKEWAELLGLTLVPELYRGPYVRYRMPQLDTEHHEGYVVRLADAFDRSAFQRSVAKWVRPDHVQTHQHWSKAAPVYNQARGN